MIPAMWFRLAAPLLLLVPALGGALWLHRELTRQVEQPEAQEEAAGLLEADLLRLSLGGDHPRLRIGEKRKKRRPRPPRILKLPPRPPREEPSRERFAVLGDGQTIYGLCIREYGSSRNWKKVLQWNGWTEAQARRLRPGTRVRLLR